jgi:hypothetical protein
MRISCLRFALAPTRKNGLEQRPNRRAASRNKHKRSIRPPNPPWEPLKLGDGSLAALSFYYSDPGSDVPVREITRRDDNKSDPNIETGTYGLFSTCERDMRAGIVRRGIDLILFCTSRSDQGRNVRVLTGYYRVGWFCKGRSVSGYSKKSQLVDYSLAAEEFKFVSPGFRLDDRYLKEYVRGVKLDRRFRRFVYIDGDAGRRLTSFLQDTPDATKEYLSEIRRLERQNLKQFGFTYHNWRMKTGFDWNLARRYIEV